MKRKGRYDNGVFLLLSAMILTPAKAVPVYAETIPAYTGYYGEVLETEGLLETVGLLETGGEKVFHMYAEDPKIARVDEETGEIHCLYPGTTRILLETEEEGEEKTQAIGSLQVEKRNVILCLQPVKQRGEADPDLTEEIRNQLQEYVIPAEADADSESEAASVDRVWRDAEPAGRESGTDSPDTGLRPEEGAAEGLEEDKKEGIEEGTEAGAEEGIETRAEKGADAGAEEVERVLSLVHWGYEDTAEGDEKGILREAGVSGIQLVFEEDERYCFNRNIAEYYPSYLTTIEDSAGSGRGDDSSNTEASGGNIPCADGIEGKDDKAPEETDERGAFGPLSAGDDSSNTEVSGENIPGAAEKPAETSDGESRPDPAESEGEIRPPIRILPEADIVPVIIPIRDGDTGAQAEKKADDSRIALQNGKDPADRTASVRTEAESRTSDKEPEERKLDPVKAFQEWKESILKETKLLGMANGTSVQGSTFPSLQLAGAVREQEVSGTVRILRSGSERGAEDVTERFLDRSADGSGYIGRQLEQIPENDGVYTLSVAYRDQDGKEAEKTMQFTVNRFGSVYAYSPELTELNGRYIREVAQDLCITEYNPNRLLEGSLQVEILHDGQIMKAPVYRTVSAGKVKEDGARKDWYRYDYVISPSNFSEEGIYTIRVYSRDEAGNSPESLDIINGRIGFQIDRTAPELTGFQELEETEGGEKTFRITAFDSLGLKEICIYLNDVCLQKADSFPDVHTAELTLQSGKENAGHLRITVEDLAGNRLDTDARDENGEYRFSPAFAFPRELQSGETKQENRRWKRGLKYAGIVLLGIVSGILGWSIGRRRKRS